MGMLSGEDCLFIVGSVLAKLNIKTAEKKIVSNELKKKAQYVVDSSSI